jgi:PEP-CTERM motif
MKTKQLKKVAMVGALLSLLCGSVAPGVAAPITWTTWISGTASGTAGSATGTLAGSGISVGYTGEMQSINTGVLWTPVSSFSGGTVGNAPPSGLNDGIQLIGGGTVLDTITFSTPVLNPVLAILSLGQAGNTARFNFTAAEPFTIESGGPSTQFGGTTIFAGGTCPANAVCGTEGSGTLQFNGLFSSISWTNPVAENYYVFTIGAPSQAQGVPEPATLALLGLGLAGLGFSRRKQ